MSSKVQSSKKVEPAYVHLREGAKEADEDDKEDVEEIAMEDEALVEVSETVVDDEDVVALEEVVLKEAIEVVTYEVLVALSERRGDQHRKVLE
jgi:hypothetical protein